MGANALRDGALADQAVLDFLDDEYVVQWVNIRKEPIPDFPAREDILLRSEMDEDGRIRDAFSLGFFLRILALDPQDEALLNPQAETPEESVQTMEEEGHFAYAQVRPDDVMEVLVDSLAAYADR